MRFTRSTLKQTFSTALALALTVALAGCSSQSSKKKKSSSTAPATSNTAPVATQSTARMGGTVRQSNMAAPRGEHTATSTANGVMVIGGENAGTTSDAIERYDNGKWGLVGKLAQARKGHTATLLSNGKLLVVGGQADSQGNQVLDSVEIVDPVSGAVTAGPALNTPRSEHVAVAFRSTQGEFVLIAGGASSNGSVASAEVYDVSRNAFLPVPKTMVEDRAAASAALLPSGKILIQGGLKGFTARRLAVNPAGAEIFDPATSDFSQAGGMGIDRYGSAMALTDQGKAVVLGGNSAAGVESSAELYDNGSWSTLSVALNQARECLTLTPLRTGRLLAVGGTNNGVTPAVEAYDPATNEVIQLGDLVTARRDHSATILSNGNVLVVGGYGAQGALASAEEYSPTAPPGTRPAPVSNPALPGTPIGMPATPATPALPPRVLAILPTKGKPGDLITIAGQNFAKSKNDNQVMFMGGAMGKVLYEVKIKRLPILGAVETLIVEVPNGAQSGDVTVIAKGQASPGKNFTIDLQSGGTPSVIFTLPKRQSPGKIVTIFGRNFARPAKDNIVRFNGEQAQLIGGITTQSVPFLGSLAVMLVKVPATATTGDLTIEAYGKVSNGKNFEVKGTTPAAPTGTTPSTPSTPSTPGTTPSTPSTPGTTPSTPSTPGMTTFYSEDFEGQTLSVSEQGGLWQAARPTPGAGPGFATSGQWCAGTAMTAGTYSANASGYLISAEVDLSNATSATLKFNQFFDTDGVDGGRVIVSPDGGQTFYLLRPNGGYLSAGVFTPGEGFAGFSGSWLRTEFDLSAFAGDKITIAFEFKADGQDQRSGWFVDDILVEGR